MVNYNHKNPGNTQKVSPGKRGDSFNYYRVELVFKSFDYISTRE